MSTATGGIARNNTSRGAPTRASGRASTVAEDGLDYTVAIIQGRGKGVMGLSAYT